MLTMSCKTVDNSKLETDQNPNVASPVTKRVIWLSPSDGKVRLGFCRPTRENLGCEDLQEEALPIYLDEYELRLRQGIVKFRPAGTPLEVNDDVKILLHPTVKLTGEEEKMVAGVMRLLKEQPIGSLEESEQSFALAAAPFSPFGGSPHSTWLTKSLIEPAKTVRDQVGPVTATQVVKLTGIGVERPAVLPDGTVILAHGYSVFWFKDGEKVYEFRSTEEVGSSPAVLSDGTVVVGKGHRVYWLKDGVKRFVFDTGGIVRSSPAVLSDGTIVVGSLDHKIYWLKDGKKQFEFETGGQVRSSPAVLFDDTVVIGAHDHKVYWLKDGKKQFEYTTGDIVEGSAVVIFDGTVVIGSRDGHIYWLKDGSKRFEFKAGGGVQSSPVLLSDDTVVIASDDFKIHWLKNGEELFEFSGQVRSPPTVLADDTIVVGVGISLYWIRNGLRRFEFQYEGEVYGSPAVLPDGRVVVSSDNGRISDNVRLFWLQ